jgi:hypothetical protein
MRDDGVGLALPEEAMRATALLVAAALCACTAPAREKTISATASGLRVAETAFESYDAKHQLDIVAAAPSFDAGQASLRSYREARKAFTEAMIAAYTALGLAVTLNSDESALAKAVSAATQAAAAWEQLKKASP